MPRFFPSCRPLGLGLLLLSLAAWAQTPRSPLPQPQVPIIHATTTLVDVPILVLDRSGQPVTDLGQGDFEVFDNGVPQRLSGFDNEPRPLSLAIVVDTSDYNAIGQARRSAQVIADMIIGAQGSAAIYVPGPEPRKLLDYTSDAAKITNVLRHLSKSPSAPQGKGSILEPLNIAMLDLVHQPIGNTRAALVISNSDPRNAAALPLIENSRSQAIPIFRIAPNRPANMPAYINPDSPQQRGTGQGSQRVQAPPAPVDMHGQPTSGAGVGNLDLAPIIGAAVNLAGKVVAPHFRDYIYDSGGMSYSPGNDGQFDRKLSLIGQELRSFYHLYFSPNDLTSTAEIHQINVRLLLPSTTSVRNITFRRTYIAVQPH